MGLMIQDVAPVGPNDSLIVAISELDVHWPNGLDFFSKAKRDDMSMKNAKLVFDDTYADVSTRIWHSEDGEFLFQCLKSNGKDLSVVCPTLERAMSLWENTKRRLSTDLE